MTKPDAPQHDDPHRDHWTALAAAAEKVRGCEDARALCNAIDRLASAIMGEEQPAQQSAAPVATVQTLGNGVAYGVLNAPLDDGTKLYAAPPAQRKPMPLTDEQIDALTPEPDGSAECNPQRVEVLPGVMCTEYEVADAWSRPLLRHLARAIEAAHGIEPQP